MLKVCGDQLQTRKSLRAPVRTFCLVAAGADGLFLRHGLREARATMADDWIKMRVWLRRDPKVISMADFLAVQGPFMNWLTDPVQQGCRNSAYEHVTRDVTASLCVTGLLEVWGTAREQGHRQGDDLLLWNCTLQTIDAICSIPCFGEAMESVDWAREAEFGSVTFPKFFNTKASPEARHDPASAAARQAKYRQRLKEKEAQPLRNVAQRVTDRVEERREEKNKGVPPLNPLAHELPEILDTPEFRNSLCAWIAYKDEKRQGYKPTGFKSMLTHAANMARAHGLPAIINAMTRAMANGWKGWDQDSLFNAPTRNGQPAKSATPSIFSDPKWKDDDEK